MQMHDYVLDKHSKMYGNDAEDHPKMNDNNAPNLNNTITEPTTNTTNADAITDTIAKHKHHNHNDNHMHVGVMTS